MHQSMNQVQIPGTKQKNLRQVVQGLFFLAILVSSIFCGGNGSKSMDSMRRTVVFFNANNVPFTIDHNGGVSTNQKNVVVGIYFPNTPLEVIPDKIYPGIMFTKVCIVGSGQDGCHPNPKMEKMMLEKTLTAFGEIDVGILSFSNFVFQEGSCGVGSIRPKKTERTKNDIGLLEFSNMSLDAIKVVLSFYDLSTYTKKSGLCIRIENLTAESLDFLDYSNCKHLDTLTVLDVRGLTFLGCDLIDKMCVHKSLLINSPLIYASLTKTTAFAIATQAVDELSIPLILLKRIIYHHRVAIMTQAVIISHIDDSILKPLFSLVVSDDSACTRVQSLTLVPTRDNTITTNFFELSLEWASLIFPDVTSLYIHYDSKADQDLHRDILSSSELFLPGFSRVTTLETERRSYSITHIRQGNSLKWSA
ncbi:hypothetical protein NEDG_01076 [Nematocida displodere]|uniref:Uncharacterized protein n=1 Tax=Nematocida displodere TaxID=1805483 RepID=A0A177EAH8_9MICR|nr:hypothetical protein NEDG_01076 [Nematocida displodere]